MNNQQQVDKKRHGSKIIRSESLNVTATSLISFSSFCREIRERAWSEREKRRMERERERESGTRRNRERERGA